jgi:hypothetical protein
MTIKSSSFGAEIDFLAFLGQKENGVAMKTLGKVGGVSIISDTMCDVAIPLQKTSNTIKPNLQY